MLTAPGTPPEIEGVGIAIDKSGAHVGIVYRDDGARLRLSHLAADFDFRDVDYANNYFCGSSALDALNQQHLAVWIEELPKIGNRIPYGFDPAGVEFDPISGVLKPVPLGKGLSCATYVLRVFSANGFALLQEDTWIARSEDADAQRNIVARMQASGATPDRIHAIGLGIGLARFRPLEVAAGVLRAPPPLPMVDAEKLAAEIQKLVSA